MAIHTPSFLFPTVVFQSIFRTWPHPVLVFCSVSHLLISTHAGGLSQVVGLSEQQGRSSHGVSLHVLFTGVANTAGALAGKGGSRSRLEVLLFLGLGQSGNELRAELKWGLPHLTQPGLPSGIPKSM